MSVELPVKIKVVGIPEATSALKGLAKIAVGIFAVDKMMAFANAGIAEWSRLRTASNELTAAIGHQSVALEKLAQTSKRHSTFRDEEITQGYKRLAMFGLTEKQIERISPTMLNLATVTGSTETAARLLGLAIERGTGRLGMYGIHVDKTMSVSARLNDILRQSENAFGGQAKAAFDAMNPLEKMNRIIEESSAGIGDALVPDLNMIADNMPEIRGAIETFTRVLATAFKFAVGGAAMLVTAFESVEFTLVSIANAIPGPWHKSISNIKSNVAAGLTASLDFIKKDFDSISKSWDPKYQEQLKAGNEAARLQKILDAETLAEQEKAQKEQLAKQKKFEEEKKSLIERLEHDAAQIGLDENEKKMADLGIQYEKDITILAGNKKALLNLEKVYADQMQNLVDEENKFLGEGKKKEEKIDEKALLEKQRAKDKFDSVTENKESKKYKNELLNLKKHYDKDKELLEKNGFDTTVLTEQFEQDKKKIKEQALSDGLSSLSGNLEKVASKHKEFIGTYKTVAIASATMDTYKAAESAYASFAAFPPLAIAAAAAAIAAGLANVQQIASAKMAYGGIVSGGTPGEDSVPAMLMPGEVVWNPAHPNPALASMITNTDNSSATSHNYHISMPITIHGSPTNTTVAQIGEVTEKALVRALKRAQNMGKISATGLTVRA